MLIRTDTYLHTHLLTAAPVPDVTPREENVGASTCVPVMFNDDADETVKVFGGKKVEKRR